MKESEVEEIKDKIHDAAWYIILFVFIMGMLCIWQMWEISKTQKEHLKLIDKQNELIIKQN